MSHFRLLSTSGLCYSLETADCAISDLCASLGVRLELGLYGLQQQDINNNVIVIAYNTAVLEVLESLNEHASEAFYTS